MTDILATASNVLRGISQTAYISYQGILFVWLKPFLVDLHHHLIWALKRNVQNTNNKKTNKQQYYRKLYRIVEFEPYTLKEASLSTGTLKLSFVISEKVVDEKLLKTIEEEIVKQRNARVWSFSLKTPSAGSSTNFLTNLREKSFGEYKITKFESNGGVIEIKFEAERMTQQQQRELEEGFIDNLKNLDYSPFVFSNFDVRNDSVTVFLKLSEEEREKKFSSAIKSYPGGLLILFIMVSVILLKKEKDEKTELYGDPGRYFIGVYDGTKDSTISKIEAGKWSVSVDLIERILIALKCDLKIVKEP